MITGVGATDFKGGVPPRTTTVLEGLQFPECPRWHDGKLWFSDMLGRRVLSVDSAGVASTVAEFDTRPSGLGFLPDGSLIVALYYKQHLMRFADGAMALHADLTVLGGDHINDMIVDRTGRAYVGLRMNPPGITAGNNEQLATDCLVTVDAAGVPAILARKLITPNGIALSGDGRTLVVNESRGSRIRAFTVADNGELYSSRVLAELPGIIPDGLCIDEQDAVWVATLDANRFDRISAAGEALASIDVGPGRMAIACTLGGHDRRTLYMLTKAGTLAASRIIEDVNDPANRDGRIEAVRVDVPGAGYP